MKYTVEFIEEGKVIYTEKFSTYMEADMAALRWKYPGLCAGNTMDIYDRSYNIKEA